ncbi:MAG: thiamine pyrophosphate-binding protein [Alphaproteobacteria bacterium]|nr:thiamine pyrophosphate-binding protein [Alphaproteobacteria bacterium]
MTTGFTVGDLVAEFLARCGVTTAFGVVSVHNIPMLDAIARRNAIRLVPSRGEMGGAHMADGYARASGELGVVITSTGPGAANAVPGLVEARFASTPLLHLTGQTSSRFVDRGMGGVHDAADQLGMLRATSKAAHRVRSATEALAVLSRAVGEALTPPCGPVSVEIPIDIQRQSIERPPGLDHVALPTPAVLAPSAADLDRLVERVSRARRPMLWLGRGALRAGEAARRLLDLGFAMVTSWAGRGIVDEDHPMTLGALHGNGAPSVERFYDTVDLMIVAGSRLRGHETLDFTQRLPAARVQIDIDPLADGRTYANGLFVHGDAAVTLAALAARLAGRFTPDPRFAADFHALKREAQDSFRDTLGPYESFPAQLRAVMPRDAIWARDITISNSTWGNKLFPLASPRQNLYPIGAGIGEGLSLGIGAAFAPGGRKVVVMTGDGGFFFNVGELWTAVQEQLDMTIIVMNDRGYGVIRHIQDATAGGRRRFDDVLGPDLEGLARLADIPFWRVQEAARFGEAARAAIATPGMSLVEVDMTAIGTHPPYHPYAPKRG